MRVAPPALEDHYDEVLRAFSAGRLVPVLGPRRRRHDGSRARAPAGGAVRVSTEKVGDSRTSPRPSRLANGIGPLHDELHLALDHDVEPSPLHAWLAALPPLLRDRGLPQQLIVSTGFDCGVERAFEAAGEELDVVVYVATGRDRGKFLHVAPDGDGDRRARAERVHRPRARRAKRRCSRSTATSTGATRASGRASPSARTITSTT